MSGEGHEATLVAGDLVGRETTPEDEIQQRRASFRQCRLEIDSRKVVVGLLRPIIEFRTIKTKIGSEEFDLEERKRKFSKVRRFLLEVAVDPLFVRDCIKDPQTALKHADFLKKQRKAGIMASESQPVDEHDPLHFLTLVFDVNVQVQRGDAPPSYGFLAKSMANMEEPERVVFAREFSEILKVVNREEDKRKKRPKRPRRLYEWWEPEAQPDYKPGQPEGTRESEVKPAPSEKDQESSTAVEKNEDSTEVPRPVDPEPGAGVVSPDDGGKLRATSRMEMPGDALAPGEEPSADEGRCDEKPREERAKKRAQQYRLRPGDPGFEEAVDELVAESRLSAEEGARRAQKEAEEYEREWRERRSQNEVDQTRGSESTAGAGADSSECDGHTGPENLDPVSAKKRELEAELPALDHTVWDSEIVRLESTAFQQELLETVESLLQVARDHGSPSEATKRVLSPTARVNAMQTVAQDVVLDPARIERCLLDPEELWRHVEVLSSLESSLEEETSYQGEGRYARDWGDDLLGLVTRLDEVNSSMRAWRCVVENLIAESRTRVEESLEGLLVFLRKLTATQESCETTEN